MIYLAGYETTFACTFCGCGCFRFTGGMSYRVHRKGDGTSWTFMEQAEIMDAAKGEHPVYTMRDGNTVDLSPSNTVH